MDNLHKLSLARVVNKNVIEYPLPENYYSMRAVMRTMCQMREKVDKILIVDSLIARRVVDLMQRDTWDLVWDFLQTMRVHCDTIELTVLEELERYS